MDKNQARRRRYGKKGQQEEQRPVILAKRETETAATKPLNEEVQPKILLKTKEDANKFTRPTMSNSNAPSSSPKLEGALDNEATEPAQAQKTTLITRSNDVPQSPTRQNISPSNIKDAVVGNAMEASAQILDYVPQMTRPAAVISSTGCLHKSVSKLFMKNNTDFLVVGVVGMQGVGKSTIMNLLANEEPEFDYYKKCFVDEEALFITKLKAQKYTARPRTESMHMYITKDRTILLDSPPVMCNAYKKDMITNELDDIRSIVTLLTVCHLLVVVTDEYINMNFLRLLRFAELMKPDLENTQIQTNYFPNILFVKNRAKRQDFLPAAKQRLDNMLRCFFKDSQLRIYLGQTAEQQRMRKGRGQEAERIVNSFLLPEVVDAAGTPHHAPLQQVVEDLRQRVFMTPRTGMNAVASDLKESVWFELMCKISAENQNFFYKTYEENMRKFLENKEINDH